MLQLKLPVKTQQTDSSFASSKYLFPTPDIVFGFKKEHFYMYNLRDVKSSDRTCWGAEIHKYI